MCHLIAIKHANSWKWFSHLLNRIITCKRSLSAYAKLDAEECPNNQASTSRALDSCDNRINSGDLEQLLEEYEASRLISDKFPSCLSDENLRALRQFIDLKGMRQYMRYLAIKESEKSKMALKMQAKKKKLVDKAGQIVKGRAAYFRSTAFAITTSHIDVMQSHRQVLAQQFGLRVVFDAHWTRSMQPNDLGLTAKQLAYCGPLNRDHRNPGQLFIANLRPDHDFYQIQLRKRMNIKEDTVPQMDRYFQYSRASYLDMFPRDCLVYLSPDSPNLLSSLSGDDVYIVGALVDKFAKCPGSTLERATQEGIRTARLPLQENVNIVGCQWLPINYVLAMLLDVYAGATWEWTIRRTLNVNRLEVLKGCRLITKYRRDDEQRLSKGFLDHLMTVD